MIAYINSTVGLIVMVVTVLFNSPLLDIAELQICLVRYFKVPRGYELKFVLNCGHYQLNLSKQTA